MDDFINMGHSMTLYACSMVTKMFQSIGFTSHSGPKSSLLPFQKREFLRFVIESLAVVTTLNNDKNNNNAKTFAIIFFGQGLKQF